MSQYKNPSPATEQQSLSPVHSLPSYWQVGLHTPEPQPMPGQHSLLFEHA